MNKLSFGKRFRKAKDIVALVLKKFPEARGNDKELIRLTWELEGFRIPKKILPFFYKVTHPETITRARRDIQSTGKYLPEPPKTIQRTLENMEQRNYFRSLKNKGG